MAAKDSLDFHENWRSLFRFFPNMPEESAAEILDRGFQKGSGRVGRRKVLGDELRFQLAVNAHIRHKLTPYESILSQVSKNRNPSEAKRAARNAVHDQIQEIADSWRGTMHIDNELTKRKPSYSAAAKASDARPIIAQFRHKARKNAKQAQREEKAREGILKFLSAENVADKTESGAIANDRRDLESIMNNLNLGADSEIRLTKHQRKRASILEDLEMLKRDPNHPMDDIRLGQVIKLHRNKGGDTTSLGSDAVARISRQVRAKLNDRAARREHRNTVREKRDHQQDLHLFQRIQRNPTIPRERKKQRRERRLREEQIRLEGKNNGGVTTLHKIDRFLTNNRAAEEKSNEAGRSKQSNRKALTQAKMKCDSFGAGPTSGVNPSGIGSLGDDAEWMDIS